MTFDRGEVIVHRRDVLCAGGAAVFGALVAALLGGSKPARAAGLSGPIPEVDRLSVRVVVDSYQIAVAPGIKKDDVDVQRFGWGLSNAPPSKTIISEFGLSMHAESQRGSEVRNVLVDFGFTPEAINNNMGLLGIDPATLDALVLSHGHYDHFGGLVGFLRENKGKLKAKIPFYVGGEECFCSREWMAPPAPGNFGSLDRKALQDANVTVTFAEGPSLVADHAFTTGQIGLSSFEKLLSPSKMKIGLDHDVGCYPETFSEEERKLGIIPDQFRHEIATAYNLRGRGLVVLDLVQPSRRRQCDQRGAGGIGCQPGPCGDRRISSGTPQGGLCARDRRGAEGDGDEICRAASLHRRALLRDRQERNAGQPAALLYGHPLRL